MNAKFPANSIREFVAQAKAQSGKMAFGKALRREEIAKLFAGLAVTPWHTTPQDMADVIREELRTLPAAVRKLNLTTN